MALRILYKVNTPKAIFFFLKKFFTTDSSGRKYVVNGQ